MAFNSYSGGDIFNFDNSNPSNLTVSFDNSSQVLAQHNEEEDTHMTADELMDDISSIDNDILSARFDKSLSQDQILDRINSLMEQRNKLTDRLQKVRNSDFKEFVDSLNLQDLQITPFFPGSRRCKLQINNEASSEIIKAQTNEPQKKWGVNLFKRKTPNDQGNNNGSRSNFYTDKQIDQYIMQYKNFNANIRSNLQVELSRLEKKKFLSPDEIAAKLRIDAELEELDIFSGVKKQ